MNGQAQLGLSAATWRLVVVAGIAVGVVYALSPLTVWFALAMMLLVRWVRRDLDGKLKPGGRPAPKAGTFMIVVVARQAGK